MKNYLDHNDKVKYVDGLLSHSQEWQWFIDLLIKSFDIHEINSWDDYEKISHSVRDIFNYFIQISKISDKTWVFSQNEFYEIWEIARYYLSIQTFDACSSKIKSSLAKVMLFCVWLTKLGNLSCNSDTSYIYDIRILNQKNYFQLINLDPYLSNEDAIFAYAEKIHIFGFNEPLKCLRDNLSAIEHPCDEHFFDKNEEKILNYNALSFQSVITEPYSSWQELYLLDMLKVNLKDNKLQPMFSSGNVTVPDMSLWEEKVLYQMKEYFHHESANFLIDTILYIVHNIPLPKEIIKLHLTLLVNALEVDKDTFSICTSSSYKIISILFKGKSFKGFEQEPTFRKLIEIIQRITDVDFIIRLKNDLYPICKTQKLLIDEFYKSKYKRIINVSNITELDTYLKDHDNPVLINTEHLLIVQAKFNEYISSENGVIISTLFYRYMIFLFNVNDKNQIVDKRWTHSEMIRIQRLWQNDYYMSQAQNMQTFSYSQQISPEIITKFNEQALLNPIFFALQCIPCSKEKLIELMQCTSQYPIIHLVNRITLSPIFPIGEVKIHLERHDIDNVLSEMIQNILETNGYKFLNILPISSYLLDIHERYKQHTFTAVSFFNREKDLYGIIQKETDIKLLPFSQTLTLGMLTQLFPILEIKIREFSTLFGVFPFKKKLENFMQYSDPSSLLREVLLKVYNEQGSFENVPDLLFVYNIMYNSNSLNVRNECIHGRDYLSGSSLKFAMSATLFALYMIIFRINTIKENVSDILELPQ
ncbi:hypothetical protein B5F98_11335 [Pseudoflavonifractor sp. An44]|uniref:hypothetical protein n=1 Tax=Pseudoflavonifractor sp. An44 TaxID=1965635 RepID=UPI000B373ABF|nr:hypothetical protein [Pseudoflavonifractor sp. An44]OUN92648.1 hypothetical protein B5F98_11335 [Pseudoflavonifractor sp. An44]